MDNNELIKSGLKSFDNEDDFRHLVGQFINTNQWFHSPEYIYKWFGFMQAVDYIKCSKCGKKLESITDNEGCTVSSPIQDSFESVAFELRKKFERYQWEIACSELYLYLKKNDQISGDCQSLSHWMMSYVFDPKIWILISCLILNEEQYLKDIVANKAPDPVHQFEGKWWFWDEVWCDRLGPYDTKEEADLAISSYISQLIGEYDE